MYSAKIVVSYFFLYFICFRQKLRVNSENQQAENFLALSSYNKNINERKERNDEN